MFQLTDFWVSFCVNACLPPVSSLLSLSLVPLRVDLNQTHFATRTLLGLVNYLQTNQHAHKKEALWYTQ